MYVFLRESVGSSVLHNLCRYILYVCRYIAKYISMANESNKKKEKKQKKWRNRVRRGRGTLAASYFRFEVSCANRPCLSRKSRRRGSGRSREKIPRV